MTDEARDDSSSTRVRRHKRGLLFLFVGAGLLGALIVVPAAVAGGRMMGSFAGGHCWGGDEELTQEVVRDRMGFAADRVLGRIDATDEQVAQVDTLLDELAPVLMQQRLEGQDLHEELAAALTADEVDADELERLRLGMLAHVDEASSLATDVLVSLSGILTVEQRAELLELGRRFHGGPPHGPR
jgi:Spy/CpxP family protein refolding chaperone